LNGWGSGGDDGGWWGRGDRLDAGDELGVAAVAPVHILDLGQLEWRRLLYWFCTIGETNNRREYRS
jgi:hypothetical protein